MKRLAFIAGLIVAIAPQFLVAGKGTKRIAGSGVKSSNSYNALLREAKVTSSNNHNSTTSDPKVSVLSAEAFAALAALMGRK